MRQPVIIAAVAASLAATNSVAPLKPLPPVSSGISVGAARHDHRRASPGVYLAKPYTCLVLVPQPGDQGILRDPAARQTNDACVISPHLRLVPWK